MQDCCDPARARRSARAASTGPVDRVSSRAAGRCEVPRHRPARGRHRRLRHRGGTPLVGRSRPSTPSELPRDGLRPDRPDLGAWADQRRASTVVTLADRLLGSLPAPRIASSPGACGRQVPPGERDVRDPGWPVRQRSCAGDGARRDRGHGRPRALVFALIRSGRVLVVARPSARTSARRTGSPRRRRSPTRGDRRSHPLDTFAGSPLPPRPGSLPRSSSACCRHRPRPRPLPATEGAPCPTPSPP